MLTNNDFHHNNSVNGCLQLSAHKKCLLLEPGIEDASLTQWLRDHTGLTTQLVDAVVEPYAA